LKVFIWRERCDNNAHTLEAEIPKILREITVTFIRRTERHCLKRMEGYRQGLSGPFLDFIMKKQKSHRTIDKEGIELARAEFVKKYPKMREATILRHVMTPTAPEAVEEVSNNVSNNSLNESESFAIPESNNGYAEI